jgi:uncharacterized tellurite resistance protein B-like protein
MLDRLMTFLNTLEARGAARIAASGDDPRIVVAALMFHVMDADGDRHTAEIEALRDLLRSTYALDETELASITQAGESADRDAVDLYSFTSVLNRHLSSDQKHRLVELLWEIVYADGHYHELEDSVVWRIAELIHVERRERIALRQRVEARRKPS